MVKECRKMGTYCGKESGERLPEQQRNWPKSYLLLLKMSLGSREQDEWYSETVKLIRTWDKPTSIYWRKERWAAFLHPCDDLRVHYLVLRRDGSSKHALNLFDMLNADFYDLNNPIAALISTFKLWYGKTAAAEAEAEDTETALKGIVATLLKYVEVIAVCVSSLYLFVEGVLAANRRDLEGLILAHLLKGELYRFLEDLVCTVQEPVLRRDHWKLDEFNSSAELVSREAEELIVTFATSESVFEKVRLMEELDTQQKRTSQQASPCDSGEDCGTAAVWGGTRLRACCLSGSQQRAEPALQRSPSPEHD